MLATGQHKLRLVLTIKYYIQYFMVKTWKALTGMLIFLVLVNITFSVSEARKVKEYEASEYIEQEMINITVGQVGVLDNMDGQQRYGLEYRFTSFSGPGGFRLIPAIGAATSSNGASFFYADLRHDFYMDNHWLLIPSFGAGFFKDSGELDLGNDLEFRSGLELAYRFNNSMRAGVAIFHLSNGSLSDENPGTEVLVFSVCIPVN
jgi:hypothetical protein